MDEIFFLKMLVKFFLIVYFNDVFLGVEEYLGGERNNVFIFNFLRVYFLFMFFRKMFFWEFFK